MHVIIAYDVTANRTDKFKRICQIYLIRIQNSVFEGELTEAQLMRIKDILVKEVKEDETVRIWLTSKILKSINIGTKKDVEDGFI
ncbi:MAG: CRISPR-associated endonuclease Cas2 [Candidatus Thermoplasmatota archaeon]|nr:CRISPR-associated endonuclease Cas2 [Candidatus Thermoplasmatota archaeon]